MSYTLSISIVLGSSQTGLTLTAQLFDTTGADYGAAVATSFVEAGNGNYLWTHAFDDAFRGGVKFLAGATLKAICEVNPSDPTAAAIADAVLDEAGAGHTGLIPTNLDAAVSSRLAGGSYTAPPTTGDIADAVLDEAGAGHTGLIPTNLDAQVSSRLASAGYTVPPTVVEIRQEMDSNSVDLNSIITYVDDLETRLTAGRAALLDNLSNLDATITGIPADVLGEAVEGAVTLAQLIRLMASALYGKASGGGTNTIKFRDLADTKDRITATVDANGNRTAVVRDGT